MQRALQLVPSSGAGPSRGTVPDAIDFTQDAADEEDVEDLDLVGSTRTKVVGVRYYTGEANLNEMVLLIREPNNPYDRWAIRVDNVRGEKIGHISREEAAVMSPLIDKGILHIEGLVQGAKGAYTMPIDLHCLCPPGEGDAVLQKLRSGGMALGAVRGGGGGGASGGGPGGPGSNVYVRPLSQPEMDSALDRMFDEIHTTAALQPAMEPNAEKVALAWLIGRENGSGLPPFWEEQRVGGGGGRGGGRGSGGGGALRFRNTLTNFAAVERPQPLRGGILADDMGLGKTLTIIALIATNRPGFPLPTVQMISLTGEAPSAEQQLVVAAAPGGAAAGGSSTGDEETAVVVAAGGGAGDGGRGGRGRGRGARTKASARREAENKVAEDMPQAKKRKGNTGAPTAATPAPTTAGPSTSAAGPSTTTTVADAAAIAAAAIQQCPPRADGPGATLIVCPVSVLSNWVTQISEHTAGNLKVYQYHGPDRSRSPTFLGSHDVVLTSYSVLAQDLADGRGLLGVRWLRVVLDEAHTIKNPKAKWTQAAVKLKAERRWAVTGTPIQNRLSDLYGLLSYLALEPLAEHSIFSRVLERPLKAGDPRAVKVLQVLMSGLAMRRTKDLRINGRPLVVLPRKNVNLVTVHLTREDRAKYDALELQGRRLISDALQASTLLDNYMNVLEIILRLRQVADAGCLCTRDPLPLTQGLGAPGAGGGGGAPLTEEERQSLVTLLTAGLQEDCPICFEPLNQTAVITRCRHIFCRPCLENVVARAAGPGCPMCRGKIALSEVVDMPADAAGEEVMTQAGTDVADPEAASAKVSALLAALKAVAQQTPPDGLGPIKSVVFSQFTGMLNLVARALSAAAIPFVRLDGSVPAKARADMVRAFASREPGSPVVFVVSLKAGGVGMNLTAASQVHLLDPWWNPAVEEQAMDRVHRLGQVRDVEVYRYVAADTIEERMMLLQDRKRELAAAAFDRRSAEDNRQMRIDDVKLLMDL